MRSEFGKRYSIPFPFFNHHHYRIILAESSFLDNLQIKVAMVMENAHRQQDVVIQSSEMDSLQLEVILIISPKYQEQIFFLQQYCQDFCSFTYQNISENFTCLILLPKLSEDSKLNCRVSHIAHNHYSLYNFAQSGLLPMFITSISFPRLYSSHMGLFSISTKSLCSITFAYGMGKQQYRIEARSELYSLQEFISWARLFNVRR